MLINKAFMISYGACCDPQVVHSHYALMSCMHVVPLCPHVCPPIIHGSGRARKTGNTNHVNDVKWTQGGRRGGGAQLHVRAQ